VEKSNGSRITPCSRSNQCKHGGTRTIENRPRLVSSVELRYEIIYILSFVPMIVTGVKVKSKAIPVTGREGP
jgi:hypothetical protein